MIGRLRLQRGIAGAALVLTGLGLGPAGAQTYGQPLPPGSPYALPAPTYHGPDEDEDLVFGGDVRPPGKWRHWGDFRNEGETMRDFLAPNGVAGGGPDEAEALRSRRFCHFHPDRC